MPHIDYLSFTFAPSPEAFEFSVDDIANRGATLLVAELGKEWFEHYAVTDYFYHVKAMRPYRTAIKHHGMGVEIHWNEALIHAYMRFTGEACAVFNRRGDGMRDLAFARASRVTRIDLAHDFRVTTRPEDVMNAGFSPRIQSVSMTKSSTGETLYLGSRQSEKFTRVYRYDPPNPRSETLRVEIEFKGDKAKSISQSLGHQAVPDVYWGEFRALQLSHDALSSEAPSESKSAPLPRQKTSEAGTDRWLRLVALPAIRSAILNGRLEKQEVLEYFEHVYTEIPF